VPERQSKGRITDRTLQRRQQFLQRTINSIARSPILRSSNVFLQFLKEEDNRTFNNFRKAASKLTPPQSLTGFISEDGVLRLDSRREDAYIRSLAYYLEHSESLKGELRLQSNALTEAMQTVGSTLTAMADTCHKLQELQAVLPNLKSGVMMYSSMSQGLKAWGHSEFTLISMTSEYLTQMLSYATAEVRPLKDLLTRRNECLSNFHKAEAKLNPKKDKLWYAGDLTKWELSAEDRKLDPVVLWHDKALAYNKMLPGETSAVSQLHDRFAYFNSRVKQESERVLWENSFLDITHFSDFTKKQSAHYTHLHVEWSQAFAQLAEASHHALSNAPLVVM
jgi:hypothetical protein